MKKILWLEMKNYLKGNIAVFILSVLAFACACFTINMVMSNYLEARAFRIDYEKSYGDKIFYKFTFPPGTAMHMQIYANDNLEKLQNVIKLFGSDPLFKFRNRAENSVLFYDSNNPDFGADDFPRYKRQFLSGYEGGWTEFSVGDDYISLRAVYADRLLQNEPNLTLSSGRWFADDEFLVNDPDNINLPIILGANYRDLYEIGDTMTNMRLSDEHPITLIIIGFLEPGSWHYDNNNARLNLDNHMVVPIPETTYNPVLDDGRLCEFFRAVYRHYNTLNNARLVTTQASDETALERAYQILYANQQYEFRLFSETSGAQKALAIYREQAVSQLVICIFTLLLCFLMFSIQAGYKLNKYKKKYGIYMMGGIKAKQLLSVMLQDMVLLFTISNILTYIITNIRFASERFVIIPLSVQSITVILTIQFILLCYMGWSGHIKVHQVDMSAALRENE